MGLIDAVALKSDNCCTRDQQNYLKVNSLEYICKNTNWHNGSNYDECRALYLIDQLEQLSKVSTELVHG